MLLLILFNYVEATVKTDHLVIFFDKDGVVRSFEARTGTQEMTPF